MVKWEWKNKIGELEDKNGFMYDIFSGSNCLAVIIYNNSATEYTFSGFWCDLAHLKRCLGLNKNYKNDNNIYADFKEIRLDTSMNNKEVLKDVLDITRAFIKAKIKVVLDDYKWYGVKA